MRTLAATSVILVLATGVRAAQDTPTPAAGSPVRIDVVVTDTLGRPVRDLTAADFVLLDNEAAQAIEAVEFTPSLPPEQAPAAAIRSEADERAAAGGPGVRLIALLIDEFHVSPASTPRVRSALLRFADEALRPGDLVIAVKPLDPLTDLRLTRDHAALRQRLATFEGRRDDYEPRSPFERTYMSRAPEAAAAQRAQVVLSALQALTLHLGSLGEGRKALVLVSEDFARAPRRDGLRVPDVPSIVRAADRGDVAIYTINPGPPDAPGPEGSGQAGGAPAVPTLLRALAEQTGGSAAGADELEDGLRRAAQDLDGYYRVTYRPRHFEDGRRHALEVRVSRPGVRARARAGHWARQPQAVRAAAGRAAAPPRRPQQISPLIRPWFGTSRGSDGRTRLTFTWEPSARARPAADTLTLSAVAADGAIVFAGRVDPIRAIGVTGNPALRAVFEAPPGLVQLDMTIRGADGRTIGTDARNLDLPDLSGRRTILTTPDVFRTRTALEFRAVSADADAAPVVSREFSRTERLLVRVRAYGEGDEPPPVAARLLSRIGQPLRNLTALSGPPVGVTQFDLPLSWLALGSYGIELAAGRERELILFQVTN